ncbi:hypothetical protein LR48_Vigan03g131500 [Vigna angularis]|uniref:Uncharacterized protein n=1 Tax=Phaseolus angularis TaxID=3914 RepID=A0A0L9U530_PHAAN|nr:hypothetical protein LR48_Vigan03g131500 [Vigna angularis]
MKGSEEEERKSLKERKRDLEFRRLTWKEKGLQKLVGGLRRLRRHAEAEAPRRNSDALKGRSRKREKRERESKREREIRKCRPTRMSSRLIAKQIHCSYSSGHYNRLVSV